MSFCLSRDGYGGDVEAWASWAQSAKGDEPPAGVTVALVFGGATKIKDYVFESARLPEIRGASGLLDRVNTEDVRRLWEEHEPDGIGCGECIIYSGGGEVLAFAPVCCAQWLADEIERRYARATLMAQAVAVWQAFELRQIRLGLLNGGQLDHARVRGLLGYNPAGGGGFGSLITPLALARYRRREGNVEEGRAGRVIGHIETTPFARRCSSCERRAAVVNARVGDVDRPLCEPCARKRVFGQLSKRGDADVSWWERARFIWEPAPPGQETPSWAKRFEEWLEREDNPEAKSSYTVGGSVRELKAPRDLGEIAQASSPPGFIGFVYADGNDMGGLLQNLETPSAYATFAEEVSSALQNSTFAALAKRLKPTRVSREGRSAEVAVHPFEILSIGGDDLILIVPAHVALALACDISAGVEQRLLESGPTFAETRDGGPAYNWAEVQRCRGSAPTRQCKVSLSAGVVIADAHTPIIYLEQLARELLGSAKRRAKLLRRRGYYGGTVDFVSLKSVATLSGTVEQFRSVALTRGDHSRGFRHLYARPYTLEEARALVETVELLKRANFPRGQLYRLRESLQEGVIPSTVDYRYFLSRDSGVTTARKRIEELWTPAGGETQASPWRGRLELRGEPGQADSLETIWPDVVELYDFVPGG
ncbi:MAG TPA: hypothetical protein VJ866_05850 [Pyrinomonadaceae bacterium]|nr:hypothetical protein [Pyrinomonadaceae bacterium]